MKILIDFTQIPIKKAGVGMYAMSLLDEIANSESVHDYYVVVLNDDKAVLELVTKRNRFKVICVNKIFRNLLFRFLLEQFYLPFLGFTNKIDVIHSLHYSFPLMPLKAKKIVTLHDMTFFLYPEFHQKVQLVFFKTMIRLSIKGCDKIICVSESTKNDVVRILDLDLTKKNKLVAIPLGTNYGVSVFDKADVAILNRHNLLAKNYLLFIGTLEPRKNVKSIIEAYSKFLLQHPKYKLVLVGQKGWDYDTIFERVKELNLEKEIVFTGFVSDKEKMQLIYNAYFFIYPSFYEGFGIPVLEAMSFGIPCITSNISSMPEVAGDAALLINPYNIDEIYNAMLLLINSKSRYDSCAEKSLIQVKKFTWEKMASKTIELYSE